MEAKNSGAVTIIWSNTGTFTATTGTIYLGGTFTSATGATLQQNNSGVILKGTMDNTGSTFTFDATRGPWCMEYGIIKNGTINGTGVCLICYFYGGTLDNVTVNCDINVGVTVFSGAVLYIQNGLVLNGTINLGSTDGSLNGSLYGINTLTLSGNGIIHLGGANNRIVSGYSGYSPNTPVILTIATTTSVRGKAGVLATGSSTDQIVNQGLISADVSGGIITINPTTFTNSGTVEARNGGKLSLGGAVTNSGILTLSVDGFNSVDLTGGVYADNIGCS